MMQAHKLLLVGCGNIGQAMLRKWCQSDIPLDISVIEPSKTLQAELESLPVAVIDHPTQLEPSYQPDVVVLALKPDVIPTAIADYTSVIDRNTLIISLAAGIATATIRNLTCSDQPVVRCMPNTPVAIGAGMLVCFANGRVARSQRDFCERLLRMNGSVAFLEDETHMDAVTAVSGSGPAYVFYFIECLTSAGIKAGLPPDVALLIAKQTMAGAAQLAVEADVGPAELRRRVTSPNGTTAAGLNVLMRSQHGLQTLVEETVFAATQRSLALALGN